jgi:hypothetical protein
MVELVIAVSFAIASFIETSSWGMRSLSSGEFVGRIVAFTNIYLYVARFFLIFFSIGLAYLVEIGRSTDSIALTAVVSFSLAIISHLFFLNRKVERKILFGILSRIRSGYLYTVQKDRKEFFYRKIFFSTFISTSLFCIAILAPFTFATIAPEFRMTIGYAGQVINAIGTVVLILAVDPVLFRMLDKGSLFRGLSAYYLGRFSGYFFGVLASAALYVFI